MATAPTDITALPAAPDPDDAEAVFDTAAYDWTIALPTFVSQANNLGDNVYANAVEAVNAATTATTKAAEALASANAAEASETISTTKASEAADSAAAAAASAATIGTTAAFSDANPVVKGSADNTKQLKFEVDGFTTSTTRTVTVPDKDGTMALTSDITSTACAQEQVIIALGSTDSFSLQTVVTIDSNRVLLTLAGASNIYAVCYDHSTKTYGTAVLVRTFAGGQGTHQSILVAADKVLIGSCPNSTAFEAVVLSLSGTSISVGTAATATLPETGRPFDAPVAAGSTFVFALSCAANQRCIAITVSGTTPTIGSTVVAFAATGNPRIRSVGATSVVVFGNISPNVSAIPITVSGTTLTAGTSATTTGVSLQSVDALSTGRWAMIYANTHTRGAIISVSGSVATMSTVALGAGATLSSQGAKVGDQIIIASEAAKVNVLTDVSGTATAGTAVTATVGAIGLAAPVGYGSDYAAFISYSTSATSYSVIKVSGNNAYVYEGAGTTTGHVTSSLGTDYILTISGKSSAVVPLGDGTLGTPFALQFGGSVRVAALPALPTALVKQSNSVAWCASGSPASPNIRINRLELTS